MRYRALLLALTLPTAVFANCQTQNSIDWTKNNALVSFLDACKRQPTAEERRLYVWGHKEKLSLLQQVAATTFMQYNRAQQFAFANARARAGKENYLQYPLFPKYLSRVKGSIGVSTVADLYHYSRDDTMLRSLDKLWRQLTHGGTVPAPEQVVPFEAAHVALDVLALEQLHPGFIADMQLPVETQYQQAMETLKTGTLPRHKELLLRGRALGLSRALKPQSPGDKKDSNISFGVANYLAETPGAFAEHFYGDDYGGIRCELSDEVEITDLSTASSLLREHGVFLSKADGSVVQFPTGYNEVANPVSFNNATLGRLIHVKTLPNIYADTGAINYQRKGSCRTISLRDFADCNSVTQLLSKTDFPVGKAGSKLYAFLKPSSSDQQYFIGKLRDCAVSQGLVEDRQAARLPALPNSCVPLTSDGFRSGGYFRDNRDALLDIVEDICDKK